MNPYAIEFHDVSLHYRINAEKGIVTLKEWVIQMLSTGVRWEELAALGHVSFAIEHGQAFGVIGPNGAGKSTLLRIAAGILNPSGGEVIARGRMAPIIELGTGFEFELSGRENVFFNGALLGRSRAEMEKRLDDIIAFADIGEFIDAPLRTYSTGMVGRLAFAIATTVDAHILLLDEILSVGDQNFRNKCTDRMEKFCRSGVTILLVSHDLEAVRRLCDRALWLDHGQVKAIGPAAEVVDQYKASVALHPVDEKIHDLPVSLIGKLG